MINFRSVRVGDELRFAGVPMVEVVTKDKAGEETVTEERYLGCIPSGWAGKGELVTVSEVRGCCVFAKNSAGVAVEFSGDDGAKCLSLPVESLGADDSVPEDMICEPPATETDY